jgi:hypothetical protein
MCDGSAPSSSAQLLRSAAYVQHSRAVPAAADAAVADAAAPAAAAQEAVQRFSGAALRRGSCVTRKQGCWQAHTYNAMERWSRDNGSSLQAVCAADLARLPLGKHSPTNLPRSIYTAQQVAAMRQLLLLERPQWKEDLEAAAAAAASASSQAVSAADELAVLRAAAWDAAAAAAAAVQAHELSSTTPLRPPKPHCCTQQSQNSCHVAVTVQGAKAIFRASFSDVTTASCAADLVRLALMGFQGSSKCLLNFPGHTYSIDQLAAFGALLSAGFPGVKLPDPQTAVAAASRHIRSRRSTRTCRSQQTDVECEVDGAQRQGQLQKIPADDLRRVEAAVTMHGAAGRVWSTARHAQLGGCPPAVSTAAAVAAGVDSSPRAQVRAVPGRLRRVQQQASVSCTCAAVGHLRLQLKGGHSVHAGVQLPPQVHAAAATRHGLLWRVHFACVKCEV